MLSALSTHLLCLRCNFSTDQQPDGVGSGATSEKLEPTDYICGTDSLSVVPY